MVHEGNTKTAEKMIKNSKAKKKSDSEVIFHIGDTVKIARGNPTVDREDINLIQFGMKNLQPF